MRDGVFVCSLSWVQPTGTLESCFKVHAVFWCRAFAGCSADAERCRAFQKADDETNEQHCTLNTLKVDVEWLTQRADIPVYCTLPTKSTHCKYWLLQICQKVDGTSSENHCTGQWLHNIVIYNLLYTCTVHTLPAKNTVTALSAADFSKRWWCNKWTTQYNFIFVIRTQPTTQLPQSLQTRSAAKHF